MIEEELENFTDSQNWDALCHYASVRGVTASLSEEDEHGNLTLLARTANPRLNPNAVAVTEGSSPFRKMLYNATIATLAQLAAQNDTPEPPSQDPNTENPQETKPNQTNPPQPPDKPN
jgi:hypothetical protein